MSINNLFYRIFYISALQFHEAKDYLIFFTIEGKIITTRFSILYTQILAPRRIIYLKKEPRFIHLSLHTDTDARLTHTPSRHQTGQQQRIKRHYASPQLQFEINLCNLVRNITESIPVY